MGKHLTLSDRYIIEAGLRQHKSLTAIADELGKSRSTISREVNSRPQICKPRGNVCRNKNGCKPKSRCTYESCKLHACRYSCPRCQENCPDFVEKLCEKAADYPYGCNTCTKKFCQYGRKIYSAKHAQYLYVRDLSESRKGISLSEEDFSLIDEKVVPRINAGQSVHVIHSTCAGELPVSERTIYSYLQQGLLGTDRIALRRTVQRKRRRKSGPTLKVDRRCHVGRCYDNYLAYMQEHPEKNVQQMDSVIGSKGGKCILTILLTNCDLQLMYLRDHNNAASVAEIFRMLRDVLGQDDFCRLFQVILTDRGSEFTDPTKIETDEMTGEHQAEVFYCDPQQSNQKSNCERNHEFIRYVIPKGSTMNNLTQEKVSLMMNHINSYPREKWNNKSPYDVFAGIYGDQIAARLGLVKVEAEAILLRPELLK